MDDLEIGMRDVLLQLALLSNGRTSSFEAQGSSDPDYTPKLSPGDAPHLYFTRRWEQAQDDIEREAVLKSARARLKEERGAGVDRSHVRVETAQQLAARIVAEGEGWEAIDVAVHFRTSTTVVRKAREAAGREAEYGRRPQKLDDQARKAEAQRMAAQGMPARQIALALGAHYSTILRDLDRKV